MSLNLPDQLASNSPNPWKNTLNELVDDLVSDAAQSICRISLACCEHIGLFAEKQPNYPSKTRKPEPQLVLVQGNGMRKP